MRYRENPRRHKTCHELKVIDIKEYGGASQKRVYRTYLKGRVPYTRLARWQGTSDTTAPLTLMWRAERPFYLEGKRCIISGPWTPDFRLCMVISAPFTGYTDANPYLAAAFVLPLQGFSLQAGHPPLVYSIMRFTKLDKVFVKFSANQSIRFAPHGLLIF